MIDVSLNKASSKDWMQAIITTGLISPFFSPFFWIWIAIIFESSTQLSEYFVGLFFGILFAYSTGWPVIILSILIFCIIIYFNYSYWISKTGWHWSLLGLAISVISVSILLFSIGEFRDIKFIFEIYLTIIPAGALSALLFKRILLKNRNI